MKIIGIMDLVIFVVGLGILAVWMILFFRGRQYDWMFEELDDQDYPVKELYFVGYEATQRLGLEYKSKKDRELRKQLNVLYGEKYADYYLRVTYSQQITMAMTVLALAAPIYFATQGNLAAFVMVVAGAGLAYYYYGAIPKSKIKERSEVMLSEFSDVVSKLALLVNSGMILREAWERTAFSKEGTIYAEMRQSVVDMRNGTPEVDALFDFGQRCMIPEIKKFSSTMIQGISKGNSDLASMLTQQSKEVWELKKQMVHRQGELADNKLLLPMCITFIGILIMVIVPIFTNLGV